MEQLEHWLQRGKENEVVGTKYFLYILPTVPSLKYIGVSYS